MYKMIYQSEEGKRKWDAQRSIKFVNKLKRKQAIGILPSIIPQDQTDGGAKVAVEEDKPESAE